MQVALSHLNEETFYYRFCLFGNTGINLRHLLQKDNQLGELKDLIMKQMQFKKESHYLELGDTGSTKNLSKTGG